MTEKIVSAIITTHNRNPRIVLSAVKSVLNQTYKNLEIIVVDDSTDDYPLRENVETEIRKLSKRIVFLKHSECKGACAARNTGLAFAHGDFVAFLDDDDIWLPRKIEEQIKGFNYDSRVALVYCGFIVVDEVRKVKYLPQRHYQEGFVFDSLLRNNFIGGSSNPLIKKECIEEAGLFDTKMQSAQDYDLWLRIALRYAVKYIDKPLLKYYVHDGERISDDVIRTISGLERINAKYHEYINKNKITWYERHRVLISNYHRFYGRKRAFSLWLECVKKQPLRIPDNMKQLVMIIIGYRVYFGLAWEKRKLVDKRMAENR